MARLARPGTRGATLAAVAAGGAFGGLARHLAAVAWPTGAGVFPWTTLTVNVAGSAAIGVLVALAARRPDRPLLRPFWGTGVLGGFTTFSTYAVDVHALAAHGAPATATAYLLGTPVLAVLAAALAARAARRVAGARAEAP